MLEVLGDSLGFITAAVASLDYLGVALLLLFLAPELVLPFAGFLVARGDLGFASVLAAGTLGALLGQLVFYGAARALGEVRVRRFIRRRGRFVLLRESDLDRVLALYERFDVHALVFARFVPTLRTLVSIPAGFLAVNPWRFTALTTLGTLLWNALLIAAGALLGRNWHALIPFANAYGWVVLGVLFAGGVYLVWRRLQVSRSLV